MQSLKEEILMLTGEDLTIEHLVALIKNPESSVEIADEAILRVQESRAFLEGELGKRIIYGVNTGFGPMASHIINPEETVHLQRNLIYSHAMGIGEPIDEQYVLSTMIIRLNTFLKGYSGVSVGLIEQLKTFINHRIIPVVPEHGAVGTSGDLVQLAHIALALMGQGEVFYQGKRLPTAEVLQTLHLDPYELKTKEGLSLINGTSTMTGIGALLCFKSQDALEIATRLGGFALELVRAYEDSIAEQLHNVRPHRGQVAIAKQLREMLESSKMLRKRDELKRPTEINGDVIEIPETVQEFYSLRCIPQILGPVYDTLAKTQQVIKVEMNSASDNPIVDWKNKLFLHGGNFHGDYIASALDQLKMTIVKLTMLSERRTNFFLNRNVNHFFPPFMNLNKPGLTLGLQGLQFVATSTVAQSQTLAFPHYVHSIPTNGDNQDIVSMGTDAALFLAKVIDNAYVVLAIELITLGQGTDFLKAEDKLSSSSRELYQQLRAVFPTIKADRETVSELPQVVKTLKQNQNINPRLNLNET